MKDRNLHELTNDELGELAGGDGNLTSEKLKEIGKVISDEPIHAVMFYGIKKVPKYGVPLEPEEISPGDKDKEKKQNPVTEPPEPERG